MTSILHPQYRDDYLQGRYPFTDASTLTDTDGTLLATPILLDAVLHPAEHVLPQRLSAIILNDLTATFQISDDSGLSCSGLVSLNPAPGVIPLTDPLGRPAGMLLADPDQLSTLQNWTSGMHTFPTGAADFVATVSIPCPELCLRGLQADGSQPLADDVWLVGENGVILTEDRGNIRIDIVGEPLFIRALFSGTDTFVAPPVARTINHVPPDGNGVFILAPSQLFTASPALRIIPDGTGGLVVELAGS